MKYMMILNKHIMIFSCLQGKLLGRGAAAIKSLKLQKALLSSAICFWFQLRNLQSELKKGLKDQPLQAETQD